MCPGGRWGGGGRQAKSGVTNSIQPAHAAASTRTTPGGACAHSPQVHVHCKVSIVRLAAASTQWLPVAPQPCLSSGGRMAAWGGEGGWFGPLPRLLRTSRARRRCLACSTHAACFAMKYVCTAEAMVWLARCWGRAQVEVPVSPPNREGSLSLFGGCLALRLVLPKFSVLLPILHHLATSCTILLNCAGACGGLRLPSLAVTPGDARRRVGPHPPPPPSQFDPRKAALSPGSRRAFLAEPRSPAPSPQSSAPQFMQVHV
jgi:hypothetical protein